MNEFVKDNDIDWREDIFSLVTARSFGNRVMISVAERDVCNRYRMELRYRFETDPKVLELVSGEKKAAECRDQILEVLKDSCRPGIEDLFIKIVDELILELDNLKKLPSSMYIVDGNTGKLITSLDNKSVVQPPDFIGEDGSIKKARPIVHPGISSTLALKVQEEHVDLITLSRAEASGPLGKMALEHKRDPISIINVAKEFLELNGVIVGKIKSGTSTEVSIEIGREPLNNLQQSPNFSFHRFRLFGELLGKKILDICSNGTCELREPVFKSNSKFQWYIIPILYSKSS